MLLPTSKERIKKLGERLASGDPISPADDHALEELVACHQRALELARPRLNGLAESARTGPLHITARPKTTRTIIEKLCREHGMSLARMRDLAGFRIVGIFDFDGQDRLYDEIARCFPADPREPIRVDRRADPRHGYRALHAEVTFDGVSIEIQIRTVLQHVWADLMERLADRLGRQIRYGEPPTAPPGMRQEQAQIIVTGMMETAVTWSDSKFHVLSPMAFDVEAVTDDVWLRLREALGNSGVDL